MALFGGEGERGAVIGGDSAQLAYRDVTVHVYRQIDQTSDKTLDRSG
ncbi:hypothetical protein BH18ACT6_BH18ACT6_15870 [soil metagenome]